MRKWGQRSCPVMREWSHEYCAGSITQSSPPSAPDNRISLKKSLPIKVTQPSQKQHMVTETDFPISLSASKFFWSTPSPRLYLLYISEKEVSVRLLSPHAWVLHTTVCQGSLSSISTDSCEHRHDSKCYRWTWKNQIMTSWLVRVYVPL